MITLPLLAVALALALPEPDAPATPAAPTPAGASPDHSGEAAPGAARPSGADGSIAPGIPGAPDLPGPPPEIERPAGAPQPEPSPWTRDGTRHALGFGWTGTTFLSKEGSQYTFHSASLGYLGSTGARGLFVHAMILVPLQARQDGRVYTTALYYRTRRGGDLLAGWQWRWHPSAGVEAEAGPGLHVNLIDLPGRPGYRDFSAMPIGLGGGAVLRWRTRARSFSRPVEVGLYGSAAVDAWDPLRSNDLAHGFTFRLGFVAGLGGRP